MNEKLKTLVGRRAVDFVEPGMRLGIGTGSTAEAFIYALADKIKAGLDICAVTTSNRSEALCQSLGIKTYDLNQVIELDIAIDGADEITPNLMLMKGGGGALLREKIVARAAKQMLVIADYSKIVPKLGNFPLPIEVNPFGLEATKKAIIDALLLLDLHVTLTLRMQGSQFFVTDGGHYIIDIILGPIDKVELINLALLEIPGVVEHGLFLNMASKALVAREDHSVELLEAMN